jgi:hypothetical protein
VSTDIVPTTSTGASYSVVFANGGISGAISSNAYGFVYEASSDGQWVNVGVVGVAGDP